MLDLPEPWDAFRRQMPIAERYAYFDHAAVAPLSAPAQQCLYDWTREMAEFGVVRWSAWRQRLEQTRRLGAELLGAHRREIALIRNTTEGVNLVAEGFPWQRGDNVVTLASEFPTNLYPWLNLASRGVETRQISAPHERLDLNKLADACDSRTRIVSVSWVGYATGWRNDLQSIADIAHRNGCLLFVDAIQGLGVLPLDVQTIPLDFLAADGHKWMLGPEGAGLFYMRSKHLDLLRPIGVGWNSVKQAGDFSNPKFDLKENAGRYEGGTYNMGGLAAFGASLAFLLQYGVESISKRLDTVTAHLCERLEGIGAKVISERSRNHWSGIVTFEVPGQNPVDVKRHCLDQGVVLNCRAERLRTSPHVYTNAEDLERLIAALRDIRPHSGESRD